MKTKITFQIIGSFIGFIVILFILELVGLGFFKFFEPKREAIKREIYENTPSYVIGKEQELTKSYREWMKADDNEKQTIENMVALSMERIKTEDIKSAQLRNFLIKSRGY
jgi:hypothetical protein